MRSLPHLRRSFTGSTLLIRCYSEREKYYIKQKDSYQKLSFLWCRNAIQIRTISLGCNFRRFSKGDGLCAFFIVEGNENLIIIQVNRIDEGIHQCLPLVFQAHVQLAEPQQPSQSNFFNRLQQRWIAYRKICRSEQYSKPALAIKPDKLLCDLGLRQLFFRNAGFKLMLGFFQLL